MTMQEKPMNIQTLRILWAGMFISQIIFGYVLDTTIKQAGPNTAEVNPQFLTIFGLLGALAYITAIILPKGLIKAAKQNLTPSASLEEILKVYTPAFIVRLALFEACTLFGFGLAFLHKDPSLFMPFVTLSMFGFFMNFPKEEKIRTMMK